MRTLDKTISRREFIAGAVVSGAALVSGGHLCAAGSIDPGHWVLMSDTHICHDRVREDRGIRPADKLAEACSQILAIAPPPAGILIAGDCAHSTGEAGDYAVLKEELAPFADAAIPVHMAMGNHDNRERFWAAFPESRARSEVSGLSKHAYVVESEGADWFVLDSSIETRTVHGEMGETQLAWLATELDKRPGKPALLIAHHYPSASEADNGLRDREAFWDVILPRKRVKAYLFGHSHAWSVKEQDGIHLINLPAMAWLFDEAQPRAWVRADLRPDGMSLRLHCLNEVLPEESRSADFTWRT